jgi:hypothetical protein
MKRLSVSLEDKDGEKKFLREVERGLEELKQEIIFPY